MAEQYSITEANRIYLDQMPVYAKIPVTVFSKINWGVTPVTNAQNQILKAKGFLGKVIGVSNSNGIIYFKIDDANVYNNGYYFYVEANKNEIITKESDAPPQQTTWVDAITQTVNNIGKGLAKLTLWGVGIFATGMFIKAIAINQLNKKNKKS